METLECRDARKSYGKKEVLHGVSLTLEKGKIYGLIGRNGAGKTTLMSMMTAQTPASAGTLVCAGEPVWENKRALSHLYFARELADINGSGIGSWKVKDYLKLAGIYLPYWDGETAERILERFRVDKKKRFHKLARGQISMVSIAVAMASKADFTILDEPAAGLDVVARQQFYRMLLEEREETERAFVISTHIIEEASDIFDEVLILKEGNLLLNEETTGLLKRCVHISGAAQAVERAVRGRRVFGLERFGRTAGATVLLEPGESVEDGGELTVKSMTLEQIFVALCGEEEEI